MGRLYERQLPEPQSHLANRRVVVTSLALVPPLTPVPPLTLVPPPTLVRQPTLAPPPTLVPPQTEMPARCVSPQLTVESRAHSPQLMLLARRLMALRAPAAQPAPQAPTWSTRAHGESQVYRADWPALL